MTSKTPQSAGRAATKLFAAVALIAAACVGTGLIARTIAAAPAPAVTTAPAPAPRPAAKPKPVAITAAPPVAQAPADRPYVIKSALTIDGPLRHGDWHWNDEGVPAGEMLVTVDLQAQTLSVFRDGYEIGVAVILYGATDKPSPLGVFPITQKKAKHISNLYDAPMPYMLRLTNDGVAIHGSNVEWGSATHGCIGVPTEFAKRLFGQVKLGDRVIITNGQMLSVGANVPAA